jgi:hypothetical protein
MKIESLLGDLNNQLVDVGTQYFMRQDVILIEFKKDGEVLAEKNSKISFESLIQKGLKERVELPAAFSFINQKFASLDSISYAVVCLNELNCYVVGCADYYDEAVLLIQNIQLKMDFETNFHWTIRPM